MITPNVQTIKVAVVVMFYMTAALVMVFVNKAVLNNAPKIPLLFLLIQLIIAVVLLHVSTLITKRVEIPKVEKATAKKLVPVIFVNIVGLVFNTLCLRDVEATFFQIARGMVLPLTIIVSAIHTHDIPSKRVLIAASVVTIGFIVGVSPSPTVPANATPSLLSLIYGLLSSLFIAIHAVLIKMSLPYCNNSTIQLAWWTNVGSAIFLLPFVILHKEPFLLLEMTRNADWDGHVFLWGCLVTGFFGFLLCIAGLLSIKVTSPITHMFSSAARSVLQTVLGVLIFGDLLNVNRSMSIFVILLGTMYYTWVKSSETASKPPRVDVESVPLTSKNENEVEDEVTDWQEPKEEGKH
ncbi:hypothetical protein AMATHDRAFT_62466 [Amanita thiersii Skay4041]|uniref:Sugar phosphate transporter domain-containing protein n=1 Tax=Amanita thiersii Skay4041 TaxID=703135 RepID=A0A2A9NQ51_9AGAR|nr:hypothetical protein AMATHDRAFT_62466 [Amanita thiersii Skay4041]